MQTFSYLHNALRKTGVNCPHALGTDKGLRLFRGSKRGGCLNSALQYTSTFHSLLAAMAKERTSSIVEALTAPVTRCSSAVWPSARTRPAACAPAPPCTPGPPAGSAGRCPAAARIQRRQTSRCVFSSPRLPCQKAQKGSAYARNNARSVLKTRSLLLHNRQAVALQTRPELVKDRQPRAS